VRQVVVLVDGCSADVGGASLDGVEEPPSSGSNGVGAAGAERFPVVVDDRGESSAAPGIVVGAAPGPPDSPGSAAPGPTVDDVADRYPPGCDPPGASCPHALAIISPRTTTATSDARVGIITPPFGWEETSTGPLIPL
jgi:hypothetical protein